MNILKQILNLLFSLSKYQTRCFSMIIKFLAIDEIQTVELQTQFLTRQFAS